MSENTEPVKVSEEQKIEEKPEETVHENGTNENSSEPAKDEPAPKDMRAIVLTGFGGLKTVKVMKKPEPSLAEGEVLIRVKACLSRPQRSFSGDHTVAPGVVIDWGHGWGWGEVAWAAQLACAHDTAVNTALYCSSQIDDYGVGGYEDVDYSACGDFSF